MGKLLFCASDRLVVCFLVEIENPISFAHCPLGNRISLSVRLWGEEKGVKGVRKKEILKFLRLSLMVRFQRSRVVHGESWLLRLNPSIPWPPFIGIDNWELSNTEDGFCRVTNRIWPYNAADAREGCLTSGWKPVNITLKLCSLVNLV